LLALEQGNPRATMATSEVEAAIYWVREVATRRLPVEVIEETDQHVVEVHHTPLGVVGAITPWNFPVLPKGEVKSGFRAFTLDLSRMRYEAPDDTLLAQHLRTEHIDRTGTGGGRIDEQRLEDYIVGGLIDYDDVSYDENAELLYDLAGQVTRHFLGYLPEEDVRKVLRMHRGDIVRAVYAQMQAHFCRMTRSSMWWR
jgi:type III restriction enzyme